jgi:FkbM family methyltransferase
MIKLIKNVKKKIINSIFFFFNLFIKINPINFKKTHYVYKSLDFSPDTLVKKLNLSIAGVVQVGAHTGQEIEKIKQIDSTIKFLAFEPSIKAFKILKKKFKNDFNVKIINKALGSCVRSSDLWVASNEGQSSSILRPKEHLNYAKDVSFNRREKINIDILDKYLDDLNSYNFLIIDTQGYELEVLKGAKKSLKFFDYIYIEVNKSEVYENCALYSEINNFLINQKFHCSHIRWWKVWGDAFYVRRDKKK